MIKKIIITSIILLLTIGIVIAADVESMKMPDGFESTGSGMYSQKDPLTNGGTGFNVAIYEYTDSDFADWTTNHTEDDYTVTKTGSLYWYTDMVDEGVIEVVEIDDTKYIVVFSATSKADGGVDQAYEYMMEFNDLNNAKVVEDV